MDKCGTLPIAVYSNEARQDQSTAPLVFEEESQPLSLTSTSEAHSERTSNVDFSDQVSDAESSYETDSEAECTANEHANEIFFTHISLNMTRSGRRVKAVSRLDL